MVIMGVFRKKTILSGIRGRVGNIVISKSRNIEIIKDAPVRPKKGSQTENQDKQRALFKLAKDFYRNVGKDVAKVGFQLRKKAKMTKANAAMQDLMANAITGEYPNFKIEFSKVRMSSPIDKIDACWNGHCVAGEGMTIDVTWEENPYPGKTTRSHDNAAIIFYDETLERNIYFGMSSRGSVPRSALRWSYEGYPQLLGHNIHCWIFFVSADKKRVSESEYLGIVNLKE